MTNSIKVSNATKEEDLMSTCSDNEDSDINDTMSTRSSSEYSSDKENINLSNRRKSSMDRKIGCNQSAAVTKFKKRNDCYF